MIDHKKLALRLIAMGNGEPPPIEEAKELMARFEAVNEEMIQDVQAVTQVMLTTDVVVEQLRKKLDLNDAQVKAASDFMAESIGKTFSLGVALQRIRTAPTIMH